MTHKDAQAVLTVDERRFLRQLFAESGQDSSPDSGGRVVIQGQAGEVDFVQRLMESGHARLVVDDHEQSLQYTLNLDESTLSSPEPVFRAQFPVLVDRRGRSRSLRVRPREGEVELRDESGRLEQPDVVDISTTGIYLKDRSGRQVASGAQLSRLDLNLPNHGGVRIGGRVVRVRRSGKQLGLAMEFDRDSLDHESQSALRQYVYERYQQLSA